MTHAGQAIENLLKGILIKATPTLVNKKGLKKPLASHDLAYLAGQANVKLLPVEEALAKRLSGFIKWAGRYPIPKTPAEPETGYSASD